jgi:hypothetical protein
LYVKVLVTPPVRVYAVPAVARREYTTVCRSGSKPTLR